MFIVIRVSGYQKPTFAYLQTATLEEAKHEMHIDFDKTKAILGGRDVNFTEPPENIPAGEEINQHWAKLSEESAHIQTGLFYTHWDILKVNQPAEINESKGE